MNEDLILNMALPYIKDESITYEQFENIYDMLSRKEQYIACEILYRNGINLIDENELADENAFILDMDDLEEDAKGFQILYDKALFKDSCSSGGNESDLVINRNIKQSN